MILKLRVDFETLNNKVYFFFFLVLGIRLREPQNGIR